MAGLIERSHSARLLKIGVRCTAAYRAVQQEELAFIPLRQALPPGKRIDPLPHEDPNQLPFSFTWLN